MGRTSRLVVVAAGISALALTVAACGGSGKRETTAKTKADPTTIPSTTTTTVFVPTAPLTGLADPSGASQTRAALNIASARRRTSGRPCERSLRSGRSKAPTGSVSRSASA